MLGERDAQVIRPRGDLGAAVLLVVPLARPTRFAPALPIVQLMTGRSVLMDALRRLSRMRQGAALPGKPVKAADGGCHSSTLRRNAAMMQCFKTGMMQ